MSRLITIFFASFSMFICGCAKPSYDLDYAAALKHESDSRATRAAVAVLGSTNGPFRALAPGGVINSNAQGQFSCFGKNGTRLSWTAPTNHECAYVSYVFEDREGRLMMVVKAW